MTGGPDREADSTLDAPWLQAASTTAVIAALQAEGGPGAARFVGGCVRDTLLALPTALDEQTRLDIDIATPLPPDRVVDALQRARLKAVPTGIEHGTVTAVSEGRPFEITTLRRDVETDGRHAVVAFTDDWAQDAARRDFRLNALYADPDGRLHDPTGAGVADARAGRIVFVGDPQRRIEEDFLRILRFFRFQAWYGRGEPDAAGFAACAALFHGIDALSAERVSKELLKLLAAPDPLPSLRSMTAASRLGGVGLIPDLARLERLRALEDRLALEPDATLRLAALSLADGWPVLAERLRLSNAQRDRLIAASGEVGDLGGMTLQAARRAIYALGETTFCDRLLLHAQADDAPRVGQLLDYAQAWRPPQLPLGGAEIKAAGVTQGPGVGVVRRAVEAWWIENDFPDDPGAIARALRTTVAGLSV